MKNKLEEQMNGLMDHAQLNDLMPDLDKEAFWQELSRELPQQKAKSRKIAFGWVARAAAVLLVIAGAWAMLRTPATEQQRLAAGHQEARVPAASPLPAETTVVPAGTAPVKTGVAVQKTAGKKPAFPGQAAPFQAPPDLVAATGPEPLGPEIPIVVVPAAAPRKVTHYLDLEEDAQAPPKEAVANTLSIEMKFNKPGSPDNVPAEKPFKQIALALGQQ